MIGGIMLLGGGTVHTWKNAVAGVSEGVALLTCRMHMGEDGSG